MSGERIDAVVMSHDQLMYHTPEHGGVVESVEQLPG